MSRTHLWLVGLLLVQLTLLALVGGRDGGGDGERRPFLPELDGLEARRIELVDEDGSRLELVREGAGWTLPAADGFPADEAKIDTLLEDLRAISVRRPVVRSARHHDTFRVADDDFVGRLLIWGEGDEPVVDVLLGSASNYRTTHARRADGDGVYEVAGLAPFDLRPQREAWVRKRLIDAEAADVKRLRVTTAGGSLALADDGSGWALAGRETDGLELDLSAVDGLLRAVTSLRVADSAGRLGSGEFGLDEPDARVELGLASGEARTIEIGAPVDGADGKRYATVDGLDFAVTVWESSLRPLLEASEDSLLRPVEAADAAAPP